MYYLVYLKPGNCSYCDQWTGRIAPQLDGVSHETDFSHIRPIGRYESCIVYYMMWYLLMLHVDQVIKSSATPIINGAHQGNLDDDLH